MDDPKEPTIPWKVLISGALAALVFLGGVEFALLVPFAKGAELVRLANPEVIAIASGMVTSAGLVAIWFQFRQTRDAARKAADDALEHRRAQARAAALRADELHAEWNGAAMRNHRDLAWLYFDYLKDHSDAWAAVAASWVHSKGEPPIPKGTKPVQKGIKDFAPYNWAIGVVAAFFVRLEAHIRLHHSDLQLTDDQLSVLMGPFFWNYWKRHLLGLCDHCEASYVADRDNAEEFPYFVMPLRSLAKMTERTGEPPPDWTPPPTKVQEKQDMAGPEKTPEAVA